MLGVLYFLLLHLVRFFLSLGNLKFEGFVNFPLGPPLYTPHLPPPIGFCDSNWGPQQVSCPSPTNCHEISLQEICFVLGNLFLYGGSPIFWKSIKERHTSGSSCKSENKAINSGTKSILSIHAIACAAYPADVFTKEF
jgi:hypothetical protein